MLPAIKIRSLVATGVKHIAFDFSSPAGRNANRQAGLKSKNVTLVPGSFDNLFPEDDNESVASLNIVQNHVELVSIMGILLSLSFLMFDLT